MAIGWAIAGSALLGGLASYEGGKAQAGAASSAAGLTAEAQKQSNALQWLMYKQGVTNMQPWLQSGQTALAAYEAGMGLPMTIPWPWTGSPASARSWWNNRRFRSWCWNDTPRYKRSWYSRSNT